MEIKFLLEVIGYFLFLGFRVVFLPVEAVLYMMLGLLLVYQYTYKMLLQASILYARGVTAMRQMARQKLLPARRWQLGWHLNKAS